MFLGRKILQVLFLICGLFLIFGCTKSSHHHVHRGMGENIHIQGAWIRAVPPASKMSAAYMKIMNHGKNDDQLISVKTNLSKVAEIHNVEKKDGMMKMMPVSFVKIPAGGKQFLKPGSYHIMLIKLNKIPKIGEEYELILHFKNAGMINVKATVMENSQMEKGMEHDHS